MADATTQPEADVPAKPSRLPLVIGLVASLAFGGGGFFAAYSGLLSGLLGGDTQAAEAGTTDGMPASADAEGAGAAPSAVQTATFVELDPLIVSLGSGRSLTHLRFRGHLEVTGGAEEAVLALMPRVMDVLNGYLRALRPEELADPSTLIRLRAQMLRRVQLVVGGDLVKDLLVAEFVLN